MQQCEETTTHAPGDDNISVWRGLAPKQVETNIPHVCLFIRLFVRSFVLSVVHVRVVHSFRGLSRSFDYRNSPSWSPFDTIIPPMGHFSPFH